MQALQQPNRELDIFAQAPNWKTYWSRAIGHYISGRVLEVGAGIGANTVLLASIPVTGWISVEPDGPSAARVRDRVRSAGLVSRCEVITGTLATLGPGELFDTVLYIDVLEHIEDDREELRQAAKHLRPGGHLIVLCPAHQKLYTEFDRAIGHYRRYSRTQMTALEPPGTRLRRAWYMDSLGMLLSLGNRLVMKQDMPTLRQIRFWDNVVIPMSMRLDPLLGRRVGKTVVAVWQKD